MVSAVSFLSPTFGWVLPASGEVIVTTDCADWMLDSAYGG